MLRALLHRIRTALRRRPAPAQYPMTNAEADEAERARLNFITIFIC